MPYYALLMSLVIPSPLATQAYMYMNFVCSEAYHTPQQAVLTRMWVKLLNDYLNPLAYPAELAGLNYSLSNSMSGFLLVVYGYNHKLKVLLEKVLEHILAFHVKEDRFLVRDRLIPCSLTPCPLMDPTLLVAMTEVAAAVMAVTGVQGAADSRVRQHEVRAAIPEGNVPDQHRLRGPAVARGRVPGRDRVP